MTCERCGAVIDPGALACPYCGAPTAAAAVARQREADEARARAQWNAAEDHRRAVAARGRIEATATQSVIWGVLGAALCCLPLGVIGVVQGVRARGLAAETKQPPPPRAMVGLVLGALSVFTSIGFVVWALVNARGEQQRADARVAELTRQIGSQASAATLDRTTACGLAEIYALKNGWSGAEGHSLHDFECVGKMVPRGDRMELDDFRFRNGTDAASDTFVCFKRGAAWLVDELRHDACHGGGAAQAPAASTTAAKGDPLAPSPHTAPKGAPSAAPAPVTPKGKTK
jgi:hypothetical protein